MTAQPYTTRFFQNLRESSRRSAKAIVPLVLELIRPRNVLDVGCGEGVWLSVFKEHGVEDVWGVDGDYVDRSALEIPEERFIALDLRESLCLQGHFDLVVSLEVAEHLPFACAEGFVESLTNHGRIVLFSAAIPYQGGVDHINEQWQDYWAQLFRRQDYVAIDCIRGKVWDNPNVEWWYAQNTILYAKQDYLYGGEQSASPLGAIVPASFAGGSRQSESRSRLRKEYESTPASSLRMVHPRKYLHAAGADGRLYSLVENNAAQVIPPRETLLLIDEDCWGREAIADRDVVPFLIREENNWRRPLDDETAIQELERQRQTGVRFIVFGKPVRWWRYYYSGLERHLNANYRSILEDDCLIAFDLRF